jgi:hypothetical protein
LVTEDNDKYYKRWPMTAKLVQQLWELSRYTEGASNTASVHRYMCVVACSALYNLKKFVERSIEATEDFGVQNRLQMTVLHAVAHCFEIDLDSIKNTLCSLDSSEKDTKLVDVEFGLSIVESASELVANLFSDDLAEDGEYFAIF